MEGGDDACDEEQTSTSRVAVSLVCYRLAVNKWHPEGDHWWIITEKALSSQSLALALFLITLINGAPRATSLRDRGWRGSHCTSVRTRFDSPRLIHSLPPPGIPLLLLFFFFVYFLFFPCKHTIIRSSGIRRESFINNLTIISAETCDCGRKEFTWSAFKFLWSCLFCSPWKHTISTSPLRWEVNAPHKYVST